MKAVIKRGSNCRVYRGAVLFPNVILGDNVTIFPGAVIGRPPLSTGATRLAVTCDPLRPVKIGKGCVIGSNAVIYSDVEVGNNSMVCDTACIREKCRIGSFCVIAQGVTINYSTRIGNHVKIMDNTHITGNMTIEDRVFISTLVSTTNDNLMGRRKESYEPKGPLIRKFATIGQGSCILPGVEIGENAIVGSNAVVTRAVAPKTVVMGTPARFARDVRPEEIITE